MSGRGLREGRWGVILLGFGGPERPEEVPAFLRKLLRREPPPALEAEVGERYRRFGGSPLPAVTRRQRQLLAAELERRGLRWPVEAGMAYAEPSIEEGLRRLAEQGVERLLLLSLTPYRSAVSVDEYERAALEALRRLELPLEPVRVPPWHEHPLYLGALAERLREALEEVPPEEREGVPVVFSAHSLPRSMVEGGDPYVRQLEATIRGLNRLLGPLNWRLGFQSRGRASAEPWLEPDVLRLLEELRLQGHRRVVVDPIGFLADHLETLYDNDVEHRERAAELGLAFHRVRCLNDSPALIRLLAEVAVAAAAAAPAGEGGA
ncbi:MAG: ferrochelatase [Firmicutes bacterium]|nr:ferrochelatase [Bacillota bacterium]